MSTTTTNGPWLTAYFCVGCHKELTRSQQWRGDGRCPLCGYKHESGSVAECDERPFRWVKTTITPPRIHWWSSVKPKVTKVREWKHEDDADLVYAEEATARHMAEVDRRVALGLSVHLTTRGDTEAAVRSINKTPAERRKEKKQVADTLKAAMGIVAAAHQYQDKEKP